MDILIRGLWSGLRTRLFLRIHPYTLDSELAAAPNRDPKAAIP
jgi:hypothetical protein